MKVWDGGQRRPCRVELGDFYTYSIKSWLLSLPVPGEAKLSIPGFVLYHRYTCKALRYDTCYTRIRVLPATKHKPYLPLFPRHRASPPIGWYSFLVPLRIGGWVGLSTQLLKVACNWTRVGIEPTTSVVGIRYCATKPCMRMHCPCTN